MTRSRPIAAAVNVAAGSTMGVAVLDCSGVDCRSNWLQLSVSIMDCDLTEEQRAIKETARAFARGAMMPFARQWDEDEVFPVDTLREAAALGLGGIYVAADVGGSALSRL